MFKKAVKVPDKDYKVIEKYGLGLFAGCADDIHEQLFDELKSNSEDEEDECDDEDDFEGGSESDDDIDEGGGE